MAKTPDAKPDPEPRPTEDRLKAGPLPSLTWDDYIDLRRQLEARLVALAAQWAASAVWPRWYYHATQRPRVVATPAEGQALGAGWQTTPVS